MKVGITGHQRLDDESAWAWVEDALCRTLDSVRLPLVGISSLALGADQLFAEVVLNLGGQLQVVLPFQGYGRTFDSPDAVARYEHLLNEAVQVEILRRTGTDEQAYLAAGQRIVELGDSLVAVWNGQPARGLGGTADIVQFALESGVEIWHLNPDQREITRHTGNA